nr:hypothetical protein [Tanacetum cinerariifolium]
MGGGYLYICSFYRPGSRLLGLSSDTRGRNMNPVVTQQVALDNSLVAPEKRLKIESQKKARKFKKIALPSRKMSHVKEAEPFKNAKRVKRPAKKSTTTLTAGVIIRDSPGESVSKKKAPA